MLLYRYRSVDRACDEINSCYFCFSSREKLNDPIESYVRVYWKGDKNAWEGLLRYYVYCLHLGLLFLPLKEKNLDLDAQIEAQIKIIRYELFRSHLNLALYKELGDKFLQIDFVKKVVNILCKESKRKIYKTELKVFLRIIQLDALAVCVKSLKEKKFVDKEKAELFLNMIDSYLKSNKEWLIEALSKLDEDASSNHLEDTKKTILFDSINKVFSDITERQICDTLSDENSNLENDLIPLTEDYPRIFVEALSEMIYPESYVVCFSKNNNNSSMWGNYAVEHKGVCLIYDCGNDNTFNLTYKNSIRKLSLKPVLYARKQVERNFFKSLGLCNRNQIKLMLTGADGSLSRIYREYNKEGWRKKYLDDGIGKNFIKMKEWKYEEEYRLSFLDSFYECIDLEHRKFKYNYSCLKGVIFGIRTAYKDKRKILSCINKCKGKLQNFKFYQAEFNDKSNVIEIREKSFWI